MEPAVTCMQRPHTITGHALLGLLLATGTLACAGTRAVSGGQAGAPGGQGIGELREEAEVQAERIAELETRLALLEAEWRNSRQAARLKPQQTVVIGGASRGAKAAAEPGEQTSERRTRPKRSKEPAPVSLILDGRPDPAAKVAAAPAAPSISGAGLPALGVVRMPGSRARAGNGTGDTRSARLEYREALGLVRTKQFEQALVALSSFIGRHGGHRLAGRALYWRGEVEYAQRDYLGALATFGELAQRYPESAKRADALLKAAYCHRRLGDEAAAAVFFRRVRKEFPESEAARIASGEGAS